jgi:hypothetical protein
MIFCPIWHMYYECGKASNRSFLLLFLWGKGSQSMERAAVLPTNWTPCTDPPNHHRPESLSTLASVPDFPTSHGIAVSLSLLWGGLRVLMSQGCPCLLSFWFLPNMLIPTHDFTVKTTVQTLPSHSVSILYSTFSCFLLPKLSRTFPNPVLTLKINGLQWLRKQT